MLGVQRGGRDGLRWEYFLISKMNFSSIPVRGFFADLYVNYWIDWSIVLVNMQYKVACFGAGFVGIPTSSVLALYNPDKKVTLLQLSSLCTIFMRNASRCARTTNHTSSRMDWRRWCRRLTGSTLASLLISTRLSTRPAWFSLRCPPRRRLSVSTRTKPMTCPTLKLPFAR